MYCLYALLILSIWLQNMSYAMEQENKKKEGYYFVDYWQIAGPTRLHEITFFIFFVASREEYLLCEQQAKSNYLRWLIETGQLIGIEQQSQTDEDENNEFMSQLKRCSNAKEATCRYDTTEEATLCALASSGSVDDFTQAIEHREWKNISPATRFKIRQAQYLAQCSDEEK